jgi:S-sulfo-L-cysteine synthase (3-phospho-L-serine-dependent)
MSDTPLVRLRGREVSKPRAALWGKLELAMPGQMKDRVALQMVLDAERSGQLTPGGVIVESSSGTLAEGLARVGTVKGYRVIIITDPRIDSASLAKLRALGAEVVIVERSSPVGGWQRSRLEKLKEVLDANPGAVWPRQYDTPSNPGAYRNSLAVELLEALGPKLAAVVATVGSGGSISGTARAIRERLPQVRVVAVDAVGSVQFHQPNRSRLQSGLGNSIIAGNIDFDVIDEVHWVSDAESFCACRELARREGIFAGGSSGSAYVAASWIAERFEPDEHVAVIFPDRGDRYADTIYSDEYMANHGLLRGDAAAAPIMLKYGSEVAERWSRADLLHGGVPYFDPAVATSGEIARQLGLD